FIRYPAADGSEGLVIATTRPETMLGDVAVAVHPDDDRYKKLIGRKLKLPLTEREIPVIADESVDKEFGTGAVKITPAHDFNDYKIWERHREKGNLDIFGIFTLDGRIGVTGLCSGDIEILARNQSFTVAITHADNRGNLNAIVGQLIPEKYRGLDRFVARKQIIADLEAVGLLAETKKHKLMVPISQRSDAIIEPMLTDQWFLDLTTDTLPEGRARPKGSAGGRKLITEPAFEAVRSGDIRFVPENWATTYTQWLENIQDWCVSRQLWWGHRIPAWYDEAGNIFVGEDEADAVKHGDKPPVGKLKQDEDVLDTWFSSALWPFSTLGWPGDTRERAAEWEKFNTFLPSSVLVTGFDIIFFWVARMVMATKYFTGRVPFKEVYINAIVRDSEGQKMSKSKGNTIDPLDLMDGIELEALVKKSAASLLIPQVREKVAKRIRHDYPEGIPAVGADALRFTFAALAGYSRTINFDLKRCEGYRNFCTKLWNATRYVLMNTEEFIAAGDPPLHTPAEHWIVNKLEHLVHDIEEHFRDYRFDLLAQDLYEFTWNDFCDWFIELSKPALNGSDHEKADSTRHTLLYVLETLLRALHPIIPFITEELWQQVAPKLGKQDDSVSLQAYPRFEGRIADPGKATGDIVFLLSAVGEIRKIRSEHGVPPSKAIRVLLQQGIHNPHLLDRIEPELAYLARLEPITRLQPGESPPRAAASVTVDDAQLYIPFEGLIDVPAELARLGKQRDKLCTDLRRVRAKLDNAAFIAQAPATVVQREQTRAAELSRSLAELESRYTELAGLTRRP
ncbi:MAG: valine--tRNA ligase, partial [Gammaproteobacteria bacterium]